MNFFLIFMSFPSIVMTRIPTSVKELFMIVKFTSTIEFMQFYNKSPYSEMQCTKKKDHFYFVLFFLAYTYFS